MTGGRRLMLVIQMWSTDHSGKNDETKECKER